MLNIFNSNKQLDIFGNNKKTTSPTEGSKLINIFTQKWRNICSSEFVVIDFETTGLSKFNDKIIEIAAIKYIDGVEDEKFVTLVNPKIKIPAQASAVNNITNEMVAKSPTEDEILPSLIYFLEGCVIIGHNICFDLGFLEETARRYGLNPAYYYADTITMAKKLFPNLTSYKLSAVAKYISMNTLNLHRAEADVKVCAEIVKIALNNKK